MWSEVGAYSIPEIVAVLASLVYIVLAARNNRYCWPAAFVGSAIFVVVLWQYQLLMDSALNVYYALMAIYGWVMWRQQANANNSTQFSTSNNTIGNESNSTLPIQSWPLAAHAIALSIVVALSLLSGYWLANNTHAAFPYLDSFTTWASLLATWMIARRVLENWLYWIVIDVLSIYLYVNKGLYFTTALFVVYVVMAVYGYWYWRRESTGGNADSEGPAPDRSIDQSTEYAAG